VPHLFERRHEHKSFAGMTNAEWARRARTRDQRIKSPMGFSFAYDAR
jgi:hypothetical protein